MTPAPFGRRLGALVIDWIACVLVGMLVTRSSYLHLNSLVPLAVYLGYATLTLGLTGVTLGKGLLHLRVAHADGSVIGVGRAALRTVLLLLVVPAVVRADDGRSLHDIAAGSVETVS